MPANRKVLNLALVLLLAITSSTTLGCRTAPKPSASSVATQNSSKWEKEIAAFEASDQTNPPPMGGIVFVGSSSIRLWKSLPSDFPGLPVLNRGFGGSQLADSYHFAERVILKYQPRQVVIYAGGNDLNAGKSPDVVYGDFVALVEKIGRAQPKTRIAYISSAPNPARWAQVENVKRLNELVRRYCRAEGLAFIDVFSEMLGRDGLPKPDIFVSDRLHMNERGYAIWQQKVAPCLSQNPVPPS